MSVSLADLQDRHGLRVEAGAPPIVTALCNADLRTDFERTGTAPYRRPLSYTLADMEREGEQADVAVSLMRQWGIALPQEP